MSDQAPAATDGSCQGRRPLAVLPDANALRAGGWSLDSENLTAVREACRRGLFALYVPEVVVRELTALGADAAVDAARGYNKGAEVLWQLGELDVKPTSVGLRASYQARVRERLQVFGANILPWPSVMHDELVDRAILNRKPFRREKGTGYKDALIWYSLLELLHANDPPLALITADSDFRDGDTLAADLLADLQEAGWDSSSVTLYRTFAELVAKEVPNLRELQAQFESRLQREPEFRESIVANLVYLADVEGPAKLEPLLANVRLLEPRSVHFDTFMPQGAPTVIDVVTAEDRETYDVALKGTVDVILEVEALPRNATTVTAHVVDHVEVEYVFQVVYVPATHAIHEFRLARVNEVGAGLLGHPVRRGPLLA